MCQYKNEFGYTRHDGSSLDGSCSYFGGTPILEQETGWMILWGFGGILTIITSLMMFFATRYHGHYKYEINADNFGTAHRMMNSGFTATVLVSQWTWVATLVQSSNVGFMLGVAGPFW